MTFIDLDNYDASRPSCVAIGIFDGVHLGHQMVLSTGRKVADELGLAALALTFEPHPMAVIAPERSPLRVSAFSQKIEWMTRPGLLDLVVVGRFDRPFAELTPREFVEQVLVRRLKAREILVGADFRFGRDRSGGVMDLESLGEYYGFGVEVVHAVSRGGMRISSTVIRTLVAGGDVDEASQLLGRPFTIRGTVVPGKKLGRSLGFPTANLSPESGVQLYPCSGVYAGRVRLGGERLLPAAISVGTNPTTDSPGSGRKIEAFIMNGFDGDLYGAVLDVEFAARLRDERRFESVDELAAQMRKDTQQAAQILLAAP